MKHDIPNSTYARDLSVFNEDFAGFVLPNVQVGCILQNEAHFLYVSCAVALCARTPHGRTFGAVEHSELYGRGVCYDAHQASQGIHFARNLPLGDAADGWITRHLCNFVHIHCHQAGLRSHTGGSVGRLASSVARSNDNDVEFKFCVHSVTFLSARKNTKNTRLCESQSIISQSPAILLSSLLR